MADGLKTLTGILSDLELARKRCGELEVALMQQQDVNYALKKEVQRYKGLIEESSDVKTHIGMLRKYSAKLQDIQLDSELEEVKIQSLAAVLNVVSDAMLDNEFSYPAELAAWLREFALKLLPEQFEVISTEMVCQNMNFEKAIKGGQYVQFEQVGEAPETDEDFRSLYQLKCQENKALQQQLRMLRRKTFLSAERVEEPQLPKLPLGELEALEDRVERLEERLKSVKSEYILHKVEMPNFTQLQREMLCVTKKAAEKL